MSDLNILTLSITSSARASISFLNLSLPEFFTLSLNNRRSASCNSSSVSAVGFDRRKVCKVDEFATERDIFNKSLRYARKVSLFFSLNKLVGVYTSSSICELDEDAASCAANDDDLSFWGGEGITSSGNSLRS